MKRSGRRISFIILSVLFFLSLIYFVIFLPPNFQFNLKGVNISVLLPFFASLFLTLYFLFAFIFNKNKQGLLFGLLAVSYLFLRLNGFTHLLFLILLLILFISFELLIYKRK